MSPRGSKMCERASSAQAVSTKGIVITGRLYFKWRYLIIIEVRYADKMPPANTSVKSFTDNGRKAHSERDVKAPFHA